MIVRVGVKPDLLHWARERSGSDLDVLGKKFPKLEAWLRQEASPTLKQLESFAKATRTPVGFFFLEKPPATERVPIPDLRTVGNVNISHPSPDLLETVYICQQRQEWYRDFARSVGEEPHSFVGSARVSDPIETTATKIRMLLCFDIEERRQLPTWIDALRRFIDQADNAGVLVMVNGVVGNNTRRKLDPREFRGFALSDGYAPVVFINGADTKAGQMFTLAHELAHLWLGESALSDVEPVSSPSHAVEQWCNKVAAELLMPLAVLRNEYTGGEELGPAVERLARYFKVSTLVVLRRIHDAGGLTERELWQEYAIELKRLLGIKRGKGGDFYPTQAARVGKRFARALVASTLEGYTLHRDAFRMLGIKKVKTFHQLGSWLGVL